MVIMIALYLRKKIAVKKLPEEFWNNRVIFAVKNAYKKCSIYNK